MDQWAVLDGLGVPMFWTFRAMYAVSCIPKLELIEAELQFIFIFVQGRPRPLAHWHLGSGRR